MSVGGFCFSASSQGPAEAGTNVSFYAYRKIAGYWGCSWFEVCAVRRGGDSDRDYRDAAFPGKNKSIEYAFDRQGRRVQ